MNTDWTIESTTTLQPRQAAPGFVEDTVFHGGPVRLDPFLALTEFHMSRPTFAPHPHAGFSAVTYLFRDSAGSFRNRDSLGDESLIEPGALHWTQAGSGMLHEEIPVESGLDCHGLQLFVNLRSDHKQAAPRAFHLSAADAPVVTPTPGVTVRVIAGRVGDTASPVEGLLTDVTMLDVELDPAVSLDLPVDPSRRVVVLVVDGAVDMGGASLAKGTVASLTGISGALPMAGGPQGATVLLLAGVPMQEPVVFRGPFCMNTQEQIDDAYARFRSGGMGTLAPSF